MPGRFLSREPATFRIFTSCWRNHAMTLSTSIGLPPVQRAYVLGLLLTGARPGELLGLRWEDVNTQWKSLSIRDKDESKGGRNGTSLIPLIPFLFH